MPTEIVYVPVDVTKELPENYKATPFEVEMFSLDGKLQCILRRVEVTLPEGVDVEKLAEAAFVPRVNKDGEPQAQLVGHAHPPGWRKHLKSFRAGAECLLPHLALMQEENERLKEKVSKLMSDNTDLIQDYESKVERLRVLAIAQEQYINLLGEELNEVVPLAASCGWKSTRHEAGKALREKIAALTK